LRPEQPPGDRVLTVVLCSLFVPGFSAAIVFASPPAHERITGAVVAVLYAALALAFGAARRRALLAARLFPQLP
jgi:hypothetical protein